MTGNAALADLIVQTARTWTGIEMPHPAARAFAADIGGLIRAFRALPPAPFDDRAADVCLVLDAYADDA
ncbi:hypothetical protein [Poseidonocella sp. HB161398]|uniref:hypothetical protein n=1 Tax=Poseidonocella sp. HB161398 TaxID=2320855 RepID=UPI001108B908|nr:hypothetical protein [Poseidonocella sp. HB161398]